MEEHQENNPIREAELTLNQATKAYLMEAAKWAKFLAIVSFVMIGILVIVALFFSAIMSLIPEYSEATELAGVSGILVTIIYLIMGLVYFFPTLYLYQFAVKTKAALETTSSESLSAGLKSLKSTFKFMGLLMIIVLGFYGLMLVIGILAAVAGLAF